jgi:hypothetical protein
MRQIAVTAVFLVAICAPGFAQQKRVEMGWTDASGYFERRTPTSDHPLQYYLSAKRQQEFLRAATDNCAIESVCNDAKVELLQEEIGAPFGKRILQIVYTMKAEPGAVVDFFGNPSQSYWKSIIAETLPGKYREIFLLKNDLTNDETFWVWPPSTVDVMTAGDKKVLFTSDSTSSHGPWCTGEFWVLQKSGPKLADFSAVTAATDKAVPAGAMAITPMCSAVDFKKLEVRVAIQKINAECRACDFEEDVVVNFRFDGTRAVPVSTRRD